MHDHGKGSTQPYTCLLIYSVNGQRWLPALCHVTLGTRTSSAWLAAPLLVGSVSSTPTMMRFEQAFERHFSQKILTSCGHILRHIFSHSYLHMHSVSPPIPTLPCHEFGNMHAPVPGACFHSSGRHGIGLLIW